MRMISSALSLMFILICRPIIIDSIIYTVDVHKMELKEQILTGSVIDYSMDDYLYVLTNRYLYKIDHKHLAINDRIPLPQRFNYLTTNNENIILITTDEIVIIDKTNLAFKRGIGIERGDYRPIIPSQQLNILEENHVIHLITDTETKTIIKILDLNNGSLLKKVCVNRILSYEYDPKNKTLTTFDIDNRLIVYDIYLNKKRVLNLEFDVKWFIKYENGFIIYNNYGVFFVNSSGELIDFQAIAIKQNRTSNNFILLTEKSIVYLDSLTFRPKRILRSNKKIVKLFLTDHPNYAIAIDTNYNFYFIDINCMTMNPVVEREAVIEEVIPRVASTDSLWYFQVGAFINYDNAVTMYNSIRQNSMPVFIDSTDLYRIKFGGFQDKITAMEIVEKTDFNGWFIFQRKIEQKGSMEFHVGLDKYIFEDGIIKGE